MPAMANIMAITSGMQVAAIASVTPRKGKNGDAEPEKTA